MSKLLIGQILPMGRIWVTLNMPQVLILIFKMIFFSSDVKLIIPIGKISWQRESEESRAW